MAPRVQGLAEVQVAEEQLDYHVLPAAVVHYQDGHEGLLTRWRLSAEEVAQLRGGEDLYLLVLTCGEPLQPVQLHVGLPDEFRGLL